MSKTTYNIHLKGLDTLGYVQQISSKLDLHSLARVFVGGADLHTIGCARQIESELSLPSLARCFDRNAVDRMLAEQNGKHVNVLIDSLGGSLATGLSISAAFKQHGDVAVHFVGLNASAATIASLGASHISMDAGAMYLVHQCSTAFFEWGSLNADQFATLIADCEKIKADLNKLDLNVAQLYAHKCKKSTADLLSLMKVGGWLSAAEAKEWGFVDEITDLDDESTPKLTDALASAMASEGMPIPNIPLADTEDKTAFSKFLSAISAFFKPNPTPTAMNKTYKFICALLSVDALTLTDNNASLTDEQLTAIEDTLKTKDEKITALEAQVADLQAKLAAKPAEQSQQVIDTKSTDPEPKNDVEQFVDTYNTARQLFSEV